MTNYLRLDLQWDEVRAWHASVCKQCDAAIVACSTVLKKLLKDGQKIENLYSLEILRSLLENDSTCRFFGTPDSKPITLPYGDDLSSHIERQQWGRRTYCHAAAFRRGFECRKMVEHLEKVPRRLERLQILEDRFATEFKGSIPSFENFKEAMRHCPAPQVFADFTLSHVDPTLHSSLIYLSRTELTKSTDLLAFLMDNVRTVLARLMIANLEVEMKPPIIDDAHLWWGHYELLKREGKKYSVNGKSGYSVAAEVCRKLVYKDCRFFAFPKRDVAIHEIPPDVYGIKRTRLLIVMNCINIASIMPVDADPELPELLSDCIMQHFEAITGFDLSSLYHMGIALQASSTAMLYYEKFIEDDAKTQKQIETADADGKLKSDVWLLDSGGFRVKYFNGKIDTIAMDKHENLFRIIKALLDHNYAATKGQLTVLTGIKDPGRCLKRALKNPAYHALRPHITLPGRRGKGGYKTTIKRDRDIESE